MPINRYIRTQTAGGNNDPSQVFYQNRFIDYYENESSSIFAFDVPQYTTIGGTKDYYIQDPYAIFTSFVRPYFRFIFNGNTSSLSGNTKIFHEVYKLSNNDYSKFSEFNQLNSTITEDVITETLDDSQTDENGVFSTTQKTTTKTSQKLTNNFLRGASLTADQIFEKLSSPVVVFSANTSGITLPYYDFYPDQYYKQLGSYKQELFEDRSQYFINTYFVFDWDKNNDYFDFNTIDLEGNIISEPYPEVEELNNTEEAHIITGGSFFGYTVRGRFFTYFTVPNKPKFEQPIVSGSINTFSPIIYFSNIEDGDESVMQVSYNTADTGFTGTIFTYKFEKDITQEIQRVSAPIKTNSSFAYRIGNVKNFTNIFGVKNSIITFTDPLTATTQSNPASIYVLSEVDSPNVGNLPIFVTPPSLTPESPTGDYVLSGKVTGSLVSGATIQLQYPDGTIVTTPTDTSGNFLFTELVAGVYNMTTIYRGYKTDTRSVNITDSSYITFKISPVWGNAYETFGYLGSEIFGNYI